MDPTSAARGEEWEEALSPPLLAQGEIQLWRARLVSPGPAALQCLSAEEHARAARFHQPRDRERFLATRVLVRRLLAACVNTSPQELRLIAGPQGKPGLAPEHPPCCFNLSHSEDGFLLAVSRETEVGVDLEYQRPALPFAELARAAGLLRLEERLRAARFSAEQACLFYREWTTTEARLKAMGTGFLGEPEVGESFLWQTHLFAPFPDFAAALAYAGQRRRVRLLSLGEGADLAGG